MRLLGKIAYWLAALTLLSAILVSLDYSLVQAVLISLIFGPCALALEYLMPKARKPMDKVYLSLAVLVAVIVLILFLHYSVWSRINQFGSQETKNVAPMLINPAFLGLILTVCPSAIITGPNGWTDGTRRKTGPSLSSPSGKA